MKIGLKLQPQISVYFENSIINLIIPEKFTKQFLILGPISRSIIINYKNSILTHFIY